MANQKDIGPFPSNRTPEPKSEYMYRCTSCGINHKESAFEKTPEGEYCKSCVSTGLHLVETPSEILSFNQYLGE